MTLRFIFLADCQLGAYAAFSGLTEQEVHELGTRDLEVRAVPKVEGFEWDAARFKAAVDVANSMRPEFVVMGGDMVNDPTSEAQHEAVVSIAAKLDPDIPMMWVPGNHDIGADTVVPTSHSIDKYREAFGPDFYAFDGGATRFVVLDTVVLDHPEEVPGELVGQLEFLAYELERASEQGRRVVLLGHHPLFLRSPDEEDTYWNLPLERRRVLLDFIHRHRVPVMFAGHWHRNSLARDDGFEMVTSGPVGYPLGDDPSGYRLVRVGAQSVDHEYHPLEL